MTCEFCEKNMKYTFNMSNRCCQIKWLRMIPKERAREWLRNYREMHSEEAMLDLIADVKNADGA